MDCSGWIWMEAGGNGPQWMTMGYNQRI